MRDDSDVPQINISKIRVDGNVAGAIFVAGSVAICLVGIPGLWSVVVGALLMGGGIAWLLQRNQTGAGGQRPGASKVANGE